MLDDQVSEKGKPDTALTYGGQEYRYITTRGIWNTLIIYSTYITEVGSLVSLGFNFAMFQRFS